MPYLRNDPQFYWSGNATLIRGNHTLRFGGSIFMLGLNHQQAEWNAGGSTEPGAGGFDFGSGPTSCKDCLAGKASKTNAYNNFGSFLLGLDTDVRKEHSGSGFFPYQDPPVQPLHGRPVADNTKVNRYTGCSLGVLPNANARRQPRSRAL